MRIEKTCAFTGHREIKEKIDTEYLSLVMQAFIDEGYDTFISGMAVGFDMLAAEIMIKLKQTNPHIKLVACVPCSGQSRYYSEEEKSKYEEILKHCDKLITVSDHYYTGCMQARDRYMVDNSSLVVAYKRRSSGGTYYTVKYAEKKNKKIYLI